MTNPYLPGPAHQPQKVHQAQPYPQLQQPYRPYPAYPPAPQNPISPQPLIVYQVVSNPSYPPCPFCHRSVPRIGRRVTGQAQLFWCAVLLLVPPFCCVPFCLENCKDTSYECSSCHRVILTDIRPICVWLDHFTSWWSLNRLIHGFI